MGVKVEGKNRVWVSDPGKLITRYDIVQYTLAEFLGQTKGSSFYGADWDPFLNNLQAFAEGPKGIAYTVESCEEFKEQGQFFSTHKEALNCAKNQGV